MSTKTEATIEDLYHVPENGKAEIVNGELRLMSPTGDLPSSAALEIAISLHAYARRTGTGRAYTDNVGFIGITNNLGGAHTAAPLPCVRSASVGC
jgi:Uma2 family endonuclease